MRLFIQIKDGQPYQHPIMDWNFKDAFSNVDMDNLPPEFAEFIRIPTPDIQVGEYEIAEITGYAWKGSIVTDVWTARPMTDDERASYDAFKAEVAAAQAAAAQLEAMQASLNASSTAPNVTV